MGSWQHPVVACATAGQSFTKCVKTGSVRKLCGCCRLAGRPLAVWNLSIMGTLSATVCSLLRSANLSMGEPKDLVVSQSEFLMIRMEATVVGEK